MKSLLNKLNARLYIVTLLVPMFFAVGTAYLFAGVQINGTPPTYATIQGALTNAPDGATLIVSTGTYVESVNIFDRNITIDGGYNTDYATKAGTGYSIIDGFWLLPFTSPGSIIDITNSVVRIIDMRMTDGGFSPISFSGNGGGLDIRDNSTVSIEDCQIYGNSCKGLGGGIYVEHSSFVSSNSFVYDNTAHFGLGVGSKGGGICAVNGNVTLIGSKQIVRDNYATDGGGIAADNAVLTIKKNADVWKNMAVTRGGGVLLENNSSALITDSGSSIGSINTHGNSVTNGNGGGLYAADSSIVLSNNANFRQNFASGDGGGVFLTNSSMTINHADIGYPTTDFTNYARANGGGVFALNSTLRVENGGQIFRAHAEGYGGGICAVDSIILFDNATLGSSSVINYGNSAGFNGGGIYAYNCSSVFNNTEISKNHSFFGGGLEISGSNSFLATNSKLIGNEAAFGGAIDFLSTVGDITIDSCLITNNKAYSLGGGIMVGFQNTLNIRGNSDISYNSSDDKGGGISLFEGASIDIFSDSIAPVVISDNVASNYGGGIYGFSGSSISGNGNLWIRRNYAQYGGGICISNNCSLNLFPSSNLVTTFMGNIAVYSGGGLFAMGSNVVANVKNVNFGVEGAGNSTTNSIPDISGGGGAFISDRAQFNAINCSFIDNTASNYGGAIYADKYSIVNVISDFDSAPSLPPNRFFNNHAAFMGGAAIAYNHGELNISDAVIISNNAGIAAGGIIASEFCTSQFVNVVIAQNSSPIYASAFVGATNYYVSFKNCTIADNISNAVISLTTPLIEMENCIVWGNQGESVLSNCAVQYSNIQNGWPGTGNIATNPIFADTGTLDYRLHYSSPCIDTGATIASITNDCIGSPRPIGSGYDMGAYELNTSPILNVIPLTVDFGDILVGNNFDLPVSVENLGNGTLNGNVINLMIPIFSAQSGSPYVISPLSSNVVTFRFSPVAEISNTNIVTFQSDGGNMDVTLIGTGIPEPGFLWIAGLLELWIIFKRRNI